METMTAPAAAVTEKDPLQLIREMGPALSQYIEEEKNNRRLSAPVVKALKDAGFYKLYLPKSLGGWEADPVTVAKVVEEVARYNTAAAWSLMVANSPNFTLSYLPEKGIEEIFGNNPDAFVAGSIHPPMRAVETKGGYIINGKNPLVSNVHEAQWIFATALVMEGDQMKINNGHPEIIGVILNAEDCRVVDTWYTIGMHATDSNDVEAKDVYVPAHLSFPLIPGFPAGRHFTSPVFRFPVAGANIASLLAPIALAVARNAINELKLIAENKKPLGSMVPIRERGVVQQKLGRAEALLQSAKAYLYNILSDCWKKVQAGETISLDEKAGLLLAAAHVNQSCAEAVELMYKAAGTSGIYTRNKLSQYFTDAQVLKQHGFMNESRYETAAQVYFGLPPDLPIITF